MSEWTNTHYNFDYTLTEADKAKGSVRIDPYFVSKMWKIGSKDDSGALWHCFKTIARFGEKNSREREIKALYAQVKRLAEIEGVNLEDKKEAVARKPNLCGSCENGWLSWPMSPRKEGSPCHMCKAGEIIFKTV